MKKVEYRAVIMYLLLEDNVPTQIRDAMNTVRTYKSWTGDGNSALSKVWVFELKYGYSSFCNDGRFLNVIDKNVSQVH